MENIVKEIWLSFVESVRVDANAKECVNIMGSVEKLEPMFLAAAQKAFSATVRQVEDLQQLAGACYAGLVANYDLPEAWADALYAASAGEPFTTDGLLPHAPATRPEVAALELKNLDLQEHLAFVERWANHHGQKGIHPAEAVLGIIQHYPAIKKITRGYADGKVPTTFDPYARIAELEAEVAALKEPKCTDDTTTSAPSVVGSRATITGAPETLYTLDQVSQAMAEAGLVVGNERSTISILMSLPATNIKMSEEDHKKINRYDYLRTGKHYILKVGRDTIYCGGHSVSDSYGPALDKGVDAELEKCNHGK